MAEIGALCGETAPMYAAVFLCARVGVPAKVKPSVETLQPRLIWTGGLKLSASNIMSCPLLLVFSTSTFIHSLLRRSKTMGPPAVSVCALSFPLYKGWRKMEHASRLLTSRKRLGRSCWARFLLVFRMVFPGSRFQCFSDGFSVSWQIAADRPNP